MTLQTLPDLTVCGLLYFIPCLVLLGFSVCFFSVNIYCEQDATVPDLFFYSPPQQKRRFLYNTGNYSQQVVIGSIELSFAVIML